MLARTIASVYCTPASTMPPAATTATAPARMEPTNMASGSHPFHVALGLEHDEIRALLTDAAMEFGEAAEAAKREDLHAGAAAAPRQLPFFVCDTVMPAMRC